ncbi:kinetochore protein Nuf2-like [Ptychodera flava]|uniref:kinetochore protein Nuf2-like n=1 Tax=Ptychodera flava TaxID=63121 RepID=UPI00396A390B
MPHYECPTLTAPEILANLDEFFGGDVHYNEADLLKPQPHKIRQLYADLLSVSNIGVRPENFTIMPVHGMHSVQSPELHEESYPLVTFSLIMQRVLVACGVDDFKIWDITSPKPKRTARFLSALINWKKLTDDRMKVYEKIKEDSALLQEKRVELLAAKDEIKSKINKIKAAQAEKAPQVEQLQQEIEEMDSKMAEMLKHQGEVQLEVQQIKADIADKTARTDQIKCREVANKEEAEKIRSRIVQSPEKMKSDIARMKHNIQSLKMMKEDSGIKLQELYLLKQKQHAMLENAKHGVKLISAIKAEQQKLREAEEELIKIQDKKCHQKDVLSEISAKANQMKRQASTKQEKLSKLALQQETKMRSIMEDIEAVTRERDALMAKKSENNKEVMKYAEEKEQIQREMELKKRSYEEEMKEMTNLYEHDLLQTVEEYHKSIAVAYDENNPWTVFPTNDESS